MNDLHEMSSRARRSFTVLSVSSAKARNHALLHMAEVLKSREEEIFAANRADLDLAEKEGLSSPLLHRLKFGSEKMAQVISGLRSLADLPDPIGQTTLATEITEGLTLYRVICPIGVVGVIFRIYKRLLPC